jgi:hypothetical protein
MDPGRAGELGLAASARARLASPGGRHAAVVGGYFAPTTRFRSLFLTKMTLRSSAPST